LINVDEFIKSRHARVMSMLMDVPRGLAGVAVTSTSIGDVRGDEGFYHYRQYDACDLARTRSFEDVWRLMIDGALPATDQERAAFSADVSAQRALPPSMAGVIDELAGLGSPDAEVRAAMAAIGAAHRLAPIVDLASGEQRAEAIALAAVLPTVVAALHRRRRGLEPIEPDPDLPVVADYLRQLRGTPAPADQVRALEQYLISTIDHGFNASTFTARVVASTGADMAAAIVAALGALSGPRHGGAPSRVLDMFDAIGTTEGARHWVTTQLDADRRISGFGHAVYRSKDPRSELLSEIAHGLNGVRVAMAAEVEDVVLDELGRRHPERRLVTNVEFWASIVLEETQVPRELFTSTFAVARVVGWTANILEQATDAKIIRPAAHYVGPAPSRA
jgi:citrate synthase